MPHQGCPDPAPTPTCPAWILSAYAPLNYLASAATIAQRAPLAGRAVGLGAGLLGSAVASYTAALIADTAVPACTRVTASCLSGSPARPR